MIKASGSLIYGYSGCSLCLLLASPGAELGGSSLIEQKSFTNSGGGHHQIRHVIMGNILLGGRVGYQLHCDRVGEREVILFFGKKYQSSISGSVLGGFIQSSK